MLYPSIVEGGRLRKLEMLAFVFFFAAPAASPQGSPQQRELTVVVVNAHTDPSLPVQGVRVSLSFVAGSEKVVDARDATNRSGYALLLVSPEAAVLPVNRLERARLPGRRRLVCSASDWSNQPFGLSYFPRMACKAPLREFGMPRRQHLDPC